MTHRHALNHPNGNPELYYFFQIKFKYCPCARWMTPRTAAKLNYQLTCKGSPNYWGLPVEATKLEYEVNPSSLFITPLTSVKSQSDAGEDSHPNQGIL